MEIKLCKSKLFNNEFTVKVHIDIYIEGGVCFRNT